MTLRLRWALLGTSLLLTTGAGCGESRVPLEDPAICTSAWQPLTTPQPFDITSSLATRDGVLYFTTANPQQLVALPTNGQPETVLAPIFGWDLWIEGDQLFYWIGNQVFGFPVAGGTARLLFDGGAGRMSSSSGSAIRHANTATDFFWTENPIVDGPTEVWRAARSSGVPTKIGTASASETANTPLPFETTMAVSNDSALLASLFGISSAVPFDGSPPRMLARPSAPTDSDINFTGLGADGVTWSIPKLGASYPYDDRELALAPADGGPIRNLWPALPPHVEPLAAWPDGNGGRVVAAAQLFSDSIYHTTIWMLGADGSGKRLGCAPATEVLGPRIGVRPVVTPEAVFVIATGETWQVVRIPR